MWKVNLEAQESVTMKIPGNFVHYFDSITKYISLMCGGETYVEEGWEMRVLLTSDWYGQCICGWSKYMWKSLFPIFFHFHSLQTCIVVPLLRIDMIMGKETFRGKENWNRYRDVKERKIYGIFLFSILYGVGKRMQREQHPHTPSVSLSRLGII